MLENLAGRLMWEQTAEEIRVEIPALFNWQVVPDAALLCVWIVGAWLYQRNFVPGRGLAALAWSCIVAGVVGLFLAAGWVLWGLTGETILTLNPAELKIQRLVIGIEWDTRTFASNDVRGLRYVPPANRWTFRDGADPNASMVQFQANDKKYSFAGGITEREACALIDRMLAVYRLSKDSPIGNDPAPGIATLS
jgi:hypothetical protein